MSIDESIVFIFVQYLQSVEEEGLSRTRSIHTGLPLLMYLQQGRPNLTVEETEGKALKASEEDAKVV